jgi:hypothetical protein
MIYLKELLNDLDLFSSIAIDKTLEIHSLILEKGDALEFAKIIYDEIDSGIFKATIYMHLTTTALLINIEIAVTENYYLIRYRLTQRTIPNKN